MSFPSIPTPRGDGRPSLAPLAQALNARLAKVYPAAHQGLSELGRRLFYPKGVPAQSAEAAGAAIDATIGQFTDGRGHGVLLPAMARAIPVADPDRYVLYSSQGGDQRLRQAWKSRVMGLGAPGAPAISMPVVTLGLTHGLSLVADLFVDPETRVLLPWPGWGNYVHIFQTRCMGRVEYYAVLDERGGLDLPELERAMGASRPGEKTVLVINFPNNPLGYQPTTEDAEVLARMLLAVEGPLVVVLDDAYQGMVWEPDRLQGSLFHLLGAADPERLLVVKVDGATKELFFFGGRVGFVTFGASGEAAAVLEEKARAIARATVSSPPAPSQSTVLEVLAAPNLEAERQLALDSLRRRWACLRDELEAHGLQAWPFNGGFFALLPARGDPERIRLALLAEGVGVVALPDIGAIRVSYAGTALEDIPRLVEHLKRHLG